MIMRLLRKCVSSAFFEYTTPRELKIRSVSAGLFQRFVQLVIISVIIGAIVWRKEYQKFDQVKSGVSTKIQGKFDLNSVLGRAPARLEGLPLCCK